MKARATLEPGGAAASAQALPAQGFLIRSCTPVTAISPADP
jgi:hypothetical protein